MQVFNWYKSDKIVSYMFKYSIIIPVFNEEATIQESYSRLKKVMNNTGDDYELIFVNDGSKDSTEDKIKDFAKKDNKVKLLSFSRNFGHQIALSAGLDYASGDAIVIIDADLQDPPEVIPEMIKKWKEGFEVVYGKRINRKGETVFKRLTAYVFYRLFNKITGHNIPVDTGDFRLIDRRVCEVMRTIPEKSRYMRGLFSWVGFKQTNVDYIREERFAGETKYPFGKMSKFALDAIFSFSYKPLTIASYIGFFISAISFTYIIYIIYLKYFTFKTVLGWSSILAVNLFFNGIVLMILGVIGEYIGRIYEETKQRPLYILREKIGFN